MGYKYQFITLAGIHNMWYNMFDLTQNYLQDGMTLTLILFQKKSSKPFEDIHSQVINKKSVQDTLTKLLQSSKEAPLLPL